MKQFSVGCPWGEHKFTSDEIAEVSIGTLQLWWQLRDSELWLAYRHIGEDVNTDSTEKKEEHDTGVPEDLGWFGVQGLAQEQAGETLIHQHGAVAVVPVQGQQSALARLEFLSLVG